MEPMLVGGLVFVVVVVGALAAAALRRWSEDEVHSVDHYRRSLDTLEEMREGPSDQDQSALENGHSNGTDDAQGALDAPDLRARKPTVRPIDPNRPTPVAPAIAATVAPPVIPGVSTAQPHGPDDAVPVIRFDDLAQPARTGADDEAPVIRFDDLAQPARTGADDEVPAFRFDDLAHPAGASADDEALAEPEQVPVEIGRSHGRAWHGVRQAIDASNRQLGAPIAAIGAAALLIVVLVLTGLHAANAPHHTKTSASALGRPVHRNHGSPAPGKSKTSTAPTTTTTAPVVSAPNVSTNGSATYQVAAGNFTLALSASRGQCWIQVTDSSGKVLFNGTISGGQSQSVTATGPVTIVAGAPSVFTATVNGSPVSLPAGVPGPLTLKFVGTASTST